MNFKLFAAAGVLVFGASIAAAQEAPAIPLTFAPSGPGSFSVAFDRPANGIVVDTFTFTPASFAGVVSVHLASSSGPVSFFAALLNDEPFVVTLDSGEASTFDFESTVFAGTPLTLQVLAFAGDSETLTAAAGSYRGLITAQAVGAVPEPATYALLLAGLAAVGEAGRRRRATARPA